MRKNHVSGRGPSRTRREVDVVPVRIPVAMFKASGNQVVNGHIVVVYEPAEMQPRSVAVRVAKWRRVETSYADVFEACFANELEIAIGIYPSHYR